MFSEVISMHHAESGLNDEMALIAYLLSGVMLFLARV
jgi:hypothetical protein